MYQQQEENILDDDEELFVWGKEVLWSTVGISFYNLFK